MLLHHSTGFHVATFSNLTFQAACLFNRACTVASFIIIIIIVFYERGVWVAACCWVLWISDLVVFLLLSFSRFFFVDDMGTSFFNTIREALDMELLSWSALILFLYPFCNSAAVGVLLGPLTITLNDAGLMLELTYGFFSLLSYPTIPHPNVIIFLMSSLNALSTRFGWEGLCSAFLEPRSLIEFCCGKSGGL